MTSDGVRPGSVIGFPQPTRPENSYSPRLPVEIPSPAPASPVMAYPAGYPVQERGGEAGEERETIEELKRGIMELYEKLPMAVRSQVNLEKLHIPNNIVTNLKVGDAARSREIQGIVDQLSPKLERFKIKTVRVGGGGMVKVEDDDTK